MLDRIKAIVSEQLNVDVDRIEPETDLMIDLEADSLDAVEIILALESEFDIEIPDEDAEDFKTIQDMLDYLEDTVQEAAE